MARAMSNDPERLTTVAEFAQMPEEDASRVELVRGRLVRSPRPAPLHARLVARLIHHLYGFVESAGTGVVLADPGALLARDPDTVRGPDIAFYSHERIPESEYTTRGFWGPPDLAVEVTSPGDRASAVQEKVTDYLDARVRQVWVVDPRTRTVTVYAADRTGRILRADDTLEGGDVLPGFRLPLAALFTL